MFGYHFRKGQNLELPKHKQLMLVSHSLFLHQRSTKMRYKWKIIPSYEVSKPINLPKVVECFGFPLKKKKKLT